MIILDNYTIKETLYEGANMVLYRGMRKRDSLPIFIKMLRAELPAPGEIERLRREYEIGRQLDSPYVIKLYDLERQGGQMMLIGEDFGGEPLSRLLRAPLEIGRFLDIAILLAAALSDIHGQGIIHKDIKPPNILVHPHTGAVKLTDFGLASPLAHVPIPKSGSSLIEGSFAYMSPEQTGRMNRGIDHRSDLYSLGVTFYEMLTGTLPFQAADPLGWVHCHIAREPKPPREIVPAIPEPIDDIVMKLLAKQAEERYQSARGLQVDLERCRQQWEGLRQIDLFPLGEGDVSDLFLIPQKLYGREEQITALLNTFEQMVVTGQPQLVLVSGYSGIGKSSLVQELHRPIVRQRGYFISGKFDQYQRDIPYSTITQAFHELIQQILRENEERIQSWREALQQALGANGQLIIDIIPHLELIIGPQPPVIELPLAEAQHRFHMVFQKFIQVFARKEHPLALFLDDLQWLDLGSLRLITYLITHPDTRYLLLLGAYRDNEVTPSHPLKLTLEEIRKSNIGVQEIVLGPLRLPHLEQLVADTVHRPAEATAPLARLIYDKTAGNPFFVIQFLTTLYQEQLLAYDKPAKKWRWDLPAIRQKGFTDNVVELLVGKLKRLPAATQEIMKLVACIGHTAEVWTLGVICGQAEDRIHANLWEAVDEGFLLRHNDTYTFVHDRVQEAAYSLIPEEQRAVQHLRIGRVFLSRLSEEQLETNIFDVVNQLNYGIKLISEPGEKELIWRLNFLAGTRAKASADYTSARHYLVQATILLPPEAWEERYPEVFKLYLELSECESLTGNFQQADELSSLLLDHACSNLDRAEVYRLRMRFYQSAGQYDNALRTMLEAVQHFGVTFPESDQEIQATLETEIGAISANLAGRRIADLVNAPLITDPNVAMIITLFVEAMPITFNTHSVYFMLLAAKGVNFSLQYGNTAASCVAYSAYAILLVANFNDIPTALEFSELSLRLNEKLDDPWRRGTILVSHAFMHNIWRRHIATSLPILEQAFVTSLEVGDLLFGGYTTLAALWIVLEKGDSLNEVLRVSEQYLAFARESHNDIFYETIRLEQQFVACLKGLTREPASFDDHTFNEAVSLARITEAGFSLGIVEYHTLKQIAAFTYGQYTKALKAAQDAAPNLHAAMAMPVGATYHFYYALTLAALYIQAPAEQQPEFAAILKQQLQRLKFWADNCPETFQNRYALVAAEVARLEGRDTDAQHLYEQAIRSARENGFVQNEGLAYLLASKFYRARGFELFADTYLREARGCYVRWGAHGKVKQLDRQYPQLVEIRPFEPTATFAAPTEQLDLLSVIKASQSISRAIFLPDLQETLMRIMLEHAGAQRGVLLLVEGESLVIYAQAETAGEETQVSLAPALPVSDVILPMSILSYVRRTGEALVLADATAGSIYADDPYIVRQKPRSVLCLPIVRHTYLTGILYLENNLITGAFTSKILTALELLASQAVISLDNARLYTNLQQENTERQRAETALATERNLLRTLIDNLPGYIYVRDSASRFMIGNIALTRFMGASTPDELVGKTDFDFYPPELARQFYTDDQNIIRSGQPMIDREDSVIDQTTGQRRWVSTTKVPLRDSQGQIVGLVGMSHDITDRKRQEEQTRQSQKLEAIGQLAGGIAHDFNNMLTGILGFTQLLLQEVNPSDRIYEDLQRIEVLSNRAADLVRQLMLFSRRDISQKNSLSLHPFLKEVTRLLERIIPENIKIELSLTPEDLAVEADPTQLQQVIINLAVNARDAMPEGGRLTIQTARVKLDEAYVQAQPDLNPGWYVQLSVSDTGMGIPPEVRPHIFDPFFTTKEVGKGTGLGLAVVYGIVKNHAGVIEVESEVDQGTTMKVYLPLSEQRIRQVTASPAGLLRGSETILLVEDEPLVLELGRTALEHFGYRVLTAQDGVEALEVFQAHQDEIALVILDVVMPRLGGRETARELKRRNPTVAILLASGYDNPREEDKERGETEAYKFVRKPYQIQELARAVRAALEHRSPKDPSAYR